MANIEWGEPYTGEPIIQHLSWETQPYGAEGKNMNEDFLSNVKSLAKDFYEAYGRPLRIVSGYRPTWRQKEIYESGIRPAALPGQSRHEKGKAIDVHKSDVELLSNMDLSKYGLESLAKINDPTHIQAIDIGNLEKRANQISFGAPTIREGEIQFVGTSGRSADNNNPLNLEYRPGSYQDKYGATPEPTHGGRFAKFPDMLSGYLAGLDQIKLDAKNGLTLAQFVSKFSPSHENPTDQLINQYSKAVGAKPNTPLSQIDPQALIIPMMSRESSTKIVGNQGGGLLEKIGNIIGPSSAQATESGQIEFGPPVEFGEPVESPMDFGEPAEAPSVAKQIAGKVTGAMAYKLPVIDMSAGELGALGVGGAAGGMLGGPPGAVAGAGLMYGAEQQAEKAYRGEQPETVGQGIKETAQDVGTGMLYDITGKLLEPIVKPVAGWVGDRLKGIGKNLYERAMKVPPSVPAEIRDKAVKEALQGNYALTKNSLDKIKQEHLVFRNQVDNIIDEAAQSGTTIDTGKVVSKLDELKSFYANLPYPDPYIETIDAMKNNILRSRGATIPVETAQAMKENLHTLLKKSYGEMKTIDKEIDKTIARGLKEELERQIPELADVNKKWAAKLNLEPLLERAVNRVRNYELVRIGDMILATGGAAGTQSLEGGFYTALVNHVLNNPQVISRIALMLNKSDSLTGKYIAKLLGYSIVNKEKEKMGATQ